MMHQLKKEWTQYMSKKSKAKKWTYNKQCYVRTLYIQQLALFLILFN